MTISLTLFSQSYYDWKNHIDTAYNSLYQSNNFLTKSQMTNFKKIIDNRNVGELKKIIDTANFSIIVITEGYHIDSSYSYLCETDELLNNYDELYRDWTYHLLDTIFPRNYVKYNGGVKDEKKRKKAIKEINKLIRREGKVQENYFKIETLIDRKKKEIKVSFRFPVIDYRKPKVFSGFYNGGSEIKLPNWIYQVDKK